MSIYFKYFKKGIVVPQLKSLLQSMDNAIFWYLLKIYNTVNINSDTT